jgi:CelD/BcsL family acetyltransferase involved in cellulose biosynthesis
MKDQLSTTGLVASATLPGNVEARQVVEAQIGERSVASVQDWAVRVYTDLDHVRATWDSLYQATPTNAGPFMTWEYVALWWRHFSQGNKLHIVVATQHCGHRVLLPLMRSGIQLEWIATPGSDYVALLYDSMPDLSGGLRAIGVHLRKQWWTKFSVTYVRPDEADHLIRAMEGLPHRIEEETGCPYIEIQERSWPTYLASLSHSRRGDMRAVERKLEKDKLPIRYETTQDPARIAELFPIMKQITAHSHIPAKQALFEGSRGAFLLDLFQTFAARKWMYVKIIYLREQPASYTACFTLDRRTGYWMAAYDEAYNKYSLGKLLLFHLFQTSFEAGDTVFDMMQGMQHYKLLWTDQVQPLTYLTFYHHPLLKRAATLQAVLRQWLSQSEWGSKLKARLKSIRRRSAVDSQP